MFGWKNGWVLTSAVILCFLISEPVWAKPVTPVGGQQNMLEQALKEALQDEYRTQASYEAILEKYDTISLFREIKESERNHIGLLHELFVKYNISYRDADLAKQAVSSPASLQGAYQAAVSGEMENINLFENLAEQDGLPPDVKAVLQKMGEESRNHLIEFKRVLNSGQ